MGLGLDFSSTVLDVRNLGNDALEYLDDKNENDLTDLLVDMTKFCIDVTNTFSDMEEGPFGEALSKILGVPAILADAAQLADKLARMKAGTATLSDEVTALSDSFDIVGNILEFCPPLESFALGAKLISWGLGAYAAQLPTDAVTSGSGSTQSTTPPLDGQTATLTTTVAPVDGVTDGSGTLTQANGTQNTYRSGSNGLINGDSWTATNQTSGTDTLNADGSTTSKITYANGTYVTVTDDGQGNITTDYFTQNGIETRSTWVHSDGTSGSVTLYQDGLTSYPNSSNPYPVPLSQSEIIQNPDGTYQNLGSNAQDQTLTTSYSVGGDQTGQSSTAATASNDLTVASSGTPVTDGSGEVITNNYNAAGNWIGDTWVSTTGAGVFADWANTNLINGTTVANASGVEITNDTAVDGSIWRDTQEAQGNTITHLDAQSVLLSDQWTDTDGASGSDTFDSIASGSGTFHNADGSGGTLTLETQGDITITNTNASGQTTSTDTWYQSTGSYDITLFNSDGSKSSDYDYLANGNVIVTDYDGDGSVADQETVAAGLVIDPDGSSFGEVVNADNTYTVYFENSFGDTTAWQFGTSGVLTGSYHTTSNDAESSGWTGSFSDGETWTSNDNGSTAHFTDAQGNAWIVYTNAAGQETGGDYSNSSTGAHGAITFNADGSEQEINYAADGSSYTIDTDTSGDVSNEFFGANGNETSDVWSRADGSGGGDVYETDGTSETYIKDAAGNTSDFYFDAQGDLVGIEWGNGNSDVSTSTGTNALGAVVITNTNSYDGSSVVETLYGGGTETIVINDGLGDVGTFTTLAGGATNDSWENSNGSSGTAITNADGSSSSTFVATYGSSSGRTNHADGSYSTFATDMQGNTSTLSYNDQGVLSDVLWSDGNADVSSTTSTNTAGATVTSQQDSYDKSSIVTTVNTDGSKTIAYSDGIGDSITDSYSAAGVLTSDVWAQADGTSGSDSYFGGLGLDGPFSTVIHAGAGGTEAAPLVVVAGGGSATVYAGSGFDQIKGGSGADTIEAGSGSAQISGGTGQATYVYDLGDGSDTINENTTTAGADTLQFGAGISASDLTYHYDATSNALTIGFGALSDQTLTLAGFEDALANHHQISTVSFADGTSLTSLQVLQKAVAIDGTTGNDSLAGTSGTDYFDGDGGNDTIVGNGGNDSFVFDAGYGQLTIAETYTSGQTPVLQLGAGISASALKVAFDGANLVLTDGVSGDQITLDGMYSSSSDGVAVVQFADGTRMVAAQLMQIGTTGTTGNDTIYGTSGADLIDGKGGSDTELGEGGSDTFVFDSGYGQLQISESYAAGQTPILQLGAGLTASMLKVTTNGSNLLLTDGVSGDQITLDGMWSSASEGVAIVEFADGSELTAAQLMQLEMTGTSGDELIYGTSGADLIDGKGGDDDEIGEGGNDTFVFDAGYGQLTIDESYSAGQQPVLQLGPGITASTLKVSTNGNNLLLTDGVSGDQVILDGMWSSSNDGVAVVHLADGTSLTAAQLMQMEMAGTVGDDTIVGTSGADLIDGKGGNDTVNGEGGADTFVFNEGYGQLSINETYANGQQPVLRLGAGVSASTLHVTTDGTNLVLTDGVSGDQVILDGMWSSGNEGVAIVQFADGTSLTAAQLIQKGLTGTTGEDTITGTPGADLIDGKGGGDYVNGAGGNDTFVFNAGYGQLAIYDVQSIIGSSPDQAVVELGAGISSSALHVTENDQHDLILTDGVAGDQIILESPFERGYPSSTAWGANVQFSDGSTLSMSQLQQMASNLNGTTGSDYLVGTTGADLIDGKGGNDYEIGNGGADTFVFNQGYGALEIGKDYGYTLQLGQGITAANLQVFESQSGVGDDLMLTDGTAGDVIRLDGVYDDDSSGVVEFADGTTVSLSQLVSEVHYFYTGEDTYRVGAGAGDQWLAYSNEESHIDIFYVDGLTSDDIATRGDSAGDLILTNRSTGSRFLLSGYFNGGQNVSIHFSNGVTWGGSDIVQAMETGLPGNDTLTGTNAAERFDGKGGNDYINGGGGSDTFVFNAGYGALEIDQVYAGGQQPVLQLGAGITASALQVTANGTSLVLTDGISGDQITLDGQNASANNGVALLQFADGSTLTAAQLLEMSQEIGGTAGGDTLTGTASADWIDGKGGNDTVTGNGGSDTFVFNPGYGKLEIDEVYTGGQQPVLRLGAGITASTLQVAVDGANLLLTDGVSGDQITLAGQNASVNDGVAWVQFADGTSLTAAQLAQLAREIRGTTGNDTLTGTTQDDLIDGKGGDDLVSGLGGNDTFVFNAGYGELEINETYAGDQQPVLQFGAGISASALQVAMVGANAVLTDGINGDQITLDNQNAPGSQGVALLQFADGTTWTAAQLNDMSHEFVGTAGNDLLTGNSGADLIDGLGGDDTVVGNGGDDTFVFDAGYGHLDVNEDFGSGDTPVLQLGAGITASDLTVTLNASGSGLVLTDGTSGDQITLENAIFDDSAYGVQEVQFADGTTLTEAQLIQRETSLPGNGGSITGGSGNDTLVAGAANESLIGGTGDEVFDFNAGFGQDTLVANGTASSNTILFGAGIAISDLTFSTDGSELVITTDNSTGVDGQASSITLLNHFVDGSPVTDVGELLFNDGSSVSMDQINQLFASSTPPPPPPSTVLTAGADNTLVSDNGVDLLQANDGNDTLTGGSGTDTLESGVGNTLMNGGTGTESYLFNTGFGQDTVVADGSATSNTIQFGAGITVSDLSFSTDGSELDITDTNSNGVDGQASSIALLDHFVNGSPVTDVGELLFSNGSYVTMDQINQLFGASTPPSGPAPSTVLTAGADNTLVSDNGVDLLQANDGNDTLTGGSGTDTLESGVGNTLMHGGAGDETYLFNTGFGQDTLMANGAASSNTIQFGAGITVSDLNFMTDGSELLIEATNSNGSDGQASSITLPDHWVDGAPVTDVGELLFNDGSYVTMDQINQLFQSSSSNEQANSAAAPMSVMNTMVHSSADMAAVSPFESQAPVTDTPSWNQTVAGSELLRQVNMLTHAIASYTGGGLGGETAMPVTPAASADLMLHAAA